MISEIILLTLTQQLNLLRKSLEQSELTARKIEGMAFRTVREFVGLSQEAVAKQTGTSRNKIGRFERGENIASIGLVRFAYLMCLRLNLKSKMAPVFLLRHADAAYAMVEPDVTRFGEMIMTIGIFPECFEEDPTAIAISDPHYDYIWNAHKRMETILISLEELRKMLLPICNYYPHLQEAA